MPTNAANDIYSSSIFELPLIVEVEAGVLSNDLPLNNGSLTAELLEIPENGALEFDPDGSFTFVPNPGFLGVDSFTYTAFDSSGGSDTAKVRIFINLLPDPPEDAILGTIGEDQLHGDTTSSYILGLEGNDTIAGRSGDDSLGGGAGDDLITGRQGNEIIDGGTGHDTLDGGRDEDVLFGSAGQDVLRGQRGDDFLIGGPGNDQMFGHAGDDTFTGGSGHDTLRGGDGADVFVLELSSGTDELRDFTPGEDMIALANGLAFEDLDFEVVGGITKVSANGELLAEVTIIGDTSLDSISNFTIF